MRRKHALKWVIAAGLVCSAACRRPVQAPPAQRSAPERASRGETRSAPEVRMRDVHFVVDPEIRLEVRRLDGRLERTRDRESAFFDQPETFRILVGTGEVAISTASMAALLNHFTFRDEDAPLKNLELSIHDGKLRQKGSLRKGAVRVPFEMEGELSLRDDGKLRLHPTSIKAAGVGVTHLLEALDVELVEVIKVRGDRGVAIEGDDLLLSPGGLLPPPAVVGRLSAVRLEEDHIVLVFGAGTTPGDRPQGAGRENFMHFQGGELRFGKLTMRRTDLRIVDGDPRDPFLFDLPHYSRQLVAGYSRTTPDLGLVAVMPDADQIQAAPAPPSPGGGL
jgi:hypothetical protein